MKYTKEELSQLVVGTQNCYEFLEKIGVEKSPGSFTYWKTKLKSLDIAISHWVVVKSEKPKKQSHEILINNPDLNFRVSGSTIKKHMLKAGVEYSCQQCGINEWKKLELSLHLDHINGNWRDNRLENLRFLCPNCHSLTETYCGKKHKTADSFCGCGKKIKKESLRCRDCFFLSLKDSPNPRVRCKIRKHIDADKKCLSCDNTTHSYTKYCNTCTGLMRRKTWPTKEDLEKLVWEIPTTHIAKKYGVSDKAVGGWCKVYGIDKPPRGYWMKEKKKQQSL